MVKRSRVLKAAEAEADLPYEETRLARRAVLARKRLAGILLVGALVMVLEAISSVSLGWTVGALVAAATAWGIRQGRLGAIVAAALLALLAILLPLRLFFVAQLDNGTMLVLVLSIGLGLGAMPDVLTLIRDAELQHAYGIWAKRET